jgi:hypothetical protein
MPKHGQVRSVVMEDVCFIDVYVVLGTAKVCVVGVIVIRTHYGRVEDRQRWGLLEVELLQVVL